MKLEPKDFRHLDNGDYERSKGHRSFEQQNLVNKITIKRKVKTAVTQRITHTASTRQVNHNGTILY